jgi:L-seryl-tRNA(Ser) seleniumtransferase
MTSKQLVDQRAREASRGHANGASRQSGERVSVSGSPRGEAPRKELTRRRFLETASGLPLVGGLVASDVAPADAAGRSGRDYFRELGVRPFINAAGTYTAMTASLMPPDVMDAIAYASRHYVMLDELHDKVGERIASLLHAEAAMVTSGAAAALTLGTAAVLTGTDRQKIVDLPNLANMKSEVIVQKGHRFGYEHAVRNCGLTLVEVETPEDVDRAVTGRTAMMLFYNNNNREGRIQDEAFVQLGKKHGIPTLNDAAADVPPVENLWKYTKMGFDLVAFSGGKGLRGPQSAGLLIGRKNLIAAARLNGPPNGNTIGRGLKVNKEEMVGMLAALERYLELDHAAETREYERRAETIRRSAVAVPGVTAEIFVPEVANHVPHVRISWDAARVAMTPEQAIAELRSGEPSIATRSESNALVVGVWMMRPGEDRIVARRLRDVLTKPA